MIRRLRLRQPETRWRVVELAIIGWLASVVRFVIRDDAYTVVLPWLRVILYTNGTEADPYLRVHEFRHVEQADRYVHAPFFWVAYAMETLRHGYEGNRFEREAYATALAPLPNWAMEP